MLYQKKFIQRTVMADTPEAFDKQLNAIYERAMQGRREPEIHYFDGLGLCATVRYYETVEIPETAAERYFVAGVQHTCADCEHFRPSFDGRVKWTHCETGGCRSGRTAPACEHHYEELERREKEHVQESDRGARQERHHAQAAR